MTIHLYHSIKRKTGRIDSINNFRTRQVDTHQTSGDTFNLNDKLVLNSAPKNLKLHFYILRAFCGG